MLRWTLTPDGEKKFNFGHPWVFASDVKSSMKAAMPGQIVQIAGPRGNLLGMTYANPHSLIALRRLSTNPDDLIDDEWVAQRLFQAAGYRQSLGLSQWSHRLIFSEGDNLPGLIIDCFFTNEQRQIFVCEILTAGAEFLMKNSELIFKNFLEKCHNGNLPYFNWDKTTLLVKRDNNFRRMEQLDLLPLTVFGEPEVESLKQAVVLIQDATDGAQCLSFSCDLIEGQKTGFFLDQRTNIETFLRQLKRHSPKSIRVLDLFCYVGQWSAQIANACKKWGIDCEVWPVDASQKALDFAEKNISSFCQNIQKTKLDIVEKCNELPQNHFNVVICDPPALIKSKKDIATGKAAYIKVNTASLKALAPGGHFVSCSCSQHLGDAELVDVLSTALRKSHKPLRWLARGQQGPDHPLTLEFPQGNYLNSWQGISPCQD